MAGLVFVLAALGLAVGLLLMAAGAFNRDVHKGGTWLASGIAVVIVCGIVLGGTAEHVLK